MGYSHALNNGGVIPAKSLHKAIVYGLILKRVAQRKRDADNIAPLIFSFYFNTVALVVAETRQVRSRINAHEPMFTEMVTVTINAFYI